MNPLPYVLGGIFAVWPFVEAGAWLYRRRKAAK